MSPSALKIHLKSALFPKCCRNLCVGVPRCVYNTFPHLWRMPNLIYECYQTSQIISSAMNFSFNVCNLLHLLLWISPWNPWVSPSIFFSFAEGDLVTPCSQTLVRSLLSRVVSWGLKKYDMIMQINEACLSSPIIISLLLTYREG
jgi:hypothetical protein